jgi:hypothetical protein
VACITVTRARVISSASAAGSRTVGRSAITTPAPASSGTYSSTTWMSKATVVTATMRSSGLSDSRCPISARRLLTALCAMTTPLGRPVVPEV